MDGTYPEKRSGSEPEKSPGFECKNPLILLNFDGMTEIRGSEAGVAPVKDYNACYS
jgi:hypothetical protein